MDIKKLVLNHFGKFHNKEIVCKPGINIIYGGNEAGKSTIHSFIRGMLFGIEKARGRAGRDDLYTKYQPLINPASYEGSMEFSFKNEDFLVYRRFYQKEKHTQLVNVTLGKEIKNVEGRLRILFPELTESAYRNTISIEQLRARTDAQLANEVRNYIANLSTTKSSEVDVNKAVSALLEKKKQITSKNTLDKINRVKEEIEEGLECERSIQQASIALKELYEQKKKKEQSYLQRMKELQTLLENEKRLDAIKQKYQWYLELLDESGHVNKKIDSITEELDENNQSTFMNALDGDIRILEELSNKLEGLRKQQEGDQANQLDVRKKQKGRRICSAIALLMGTLFCFIPIGSHVSRITVGVLLVVSSLFYYALIMKRMKAELESSVTEEKSTKLQMLQIENKKREILSKYKCNDISSLREYQKLYGAKEVRLQQLKGQLLEYQDQRDKLKYKLNNLYNEMSTVANQIFHCNEVSEEVIRQLERELSLYKLQAKQLQEEYETDKMQVAIQIDRFENVIIQNQEKESELNEKQREYEDLLHTQEEDEFMLEAIKLTVETIKELSIEIHDSFGTTLSNKVSEQLSFLTDGKYKEVLVDENLNIKILHELQYIPLEKLSVGAMDQVYFALRLAIGDLLFEGEPMPIILDDSFAYYDDERLQSALKILSSMKDRQIILFTCHHREEAYLLESGTPFHYVKL